MGERGILATQRRTGAARPTAIPDAKICDIAGVYLGRLGKVFALGTIEDRLRRERLPSDLPMDTGIIALVDELTAVAQALDWKGSGDDPESSYREFLSKVDRKVAPDRCVHLVCLQRGPGMADATRGWMSTHPRSSVSCPATEELWADEIVRYLGKRSSRGIRPLALELTEAFRQWVGTGAAPESAFAWVWRTARPVS
ncbi:hypothetical protein [Saccharopolyspora gloriosae]|uniref:hypothetical protein n=1 Tax=Saccharopolyspora gloriosae TaxID=455344 RepID=UPI001FB7D9D8|nr:hypothetical protein [Saccharopolyspora gloriosae]